MQYRNRALVHGENINLIDSDGVDSVQGTVDVMRLRKHSVDWKVETMVVLRRQPEDGDTSSFEHGRKLVTSQQRRNGETLAFDPQRLRLKRGN